MKRLGLIALLLLASFGCGRSTNQGSCLVSEAKKEITGNIMTFHLTGSPWIVTADLDANVTIENTDRKTSCKMMMESVLSVYQGEGSPIYFRTSEIGSDELRTVDGFACRESKEPVKLDLESESNVTRTLESLGICTMRP
jgi:hypothetical protein